MNSFAELPVHESPVDRLAGQQTGMRMPVPSGLDSAPGSGLWFTVTARDVAVATAAASSGETGWMMFKGELDSVPRVTRNCATSLDFEWMFGDCCGAERAESYLRASALRFSERYAAQRGFRRRGSRLAREHLRASFFAPDYSSRASGPSLDFFAAAQEFS